MSLRIVPPPGEQLNTNTKTKTRAKTKTEGSDAIDATSVENAGVLFLAFVLIFVPICTYTVARDNWGHDIGTHVGFATGVVCVLVSSYVLFFSGLFYKFDWD